MLFGFERNSYFQNFRDLGGFDNSQGCIAQKGKYFRAGMPACLAEAQYQFLKEYNISTVIDFRIAEEKRKTDWYKKDCYGIDYISLPFYDRASVSLIMEMEKNDSFDWSQIYIDVLERGKVWIKKVFTTLALVQSGILFHCASGKDRTGVIAALLLELSGAEDVWIILDYAMSQYMIENAKGSFYKTSPETMKTFLEFLREHYGNAEGYLLSIGVPKNFLNKVKSRFFD